MTSLVWKGYSILEQTRSFHPPRALIMKSLVINLDRATERLVHMNATFRSRNLDFTRIAAVDAKLLQQMEIARWCSGDAKLGLAELACFQSHRKCWQRVIELGLSHAAIFEDDVLLGTDAIAILKSSVWIPPHVDMIKLETNARPTIVEKTSTCRVADRSIKRLCGAHFNTGAYIVSRNGAQILLAASRQVDRPVDLFLFDEEGLARLPIYQLVPALCIQPFVANRLQVHAGDPLLMTSAVDQDRQARRPQGVRRVRHKLRRIKENVREVLRGSLRRFGGKHEWGPVLFK